MLNPAIQCANELAKAEFSKEMLDKLVRESLKKLAVFGTLGWVRQELFAAFEALDLQSDQAAYIRTAIVRLS